jgi:hypothetical protein
MSDLPFLGVESIGFVEEKVSSRLKIRSGMGGWEKS